MSALNQPDSIRVTQACKIYGLDRRTIARLVPIASLGHRSKFVKISDIEAAIAARTSAPDASEPAERAARKQPRPRQGKRRDLL